MGTRDNKYLRFNVVVFLLLLFFTTEAYFKIVLFSNGESTWLLQVTKGIVLISLSVCVLIKQPNQLWLLGVLLISFLIGQLSLVNGISKEAVITFTKLIFPIVLLLFFNSYTQSVKQNDVTFLVFEYIMLFNAFLIGIGILFQIKFVHTYLGARFGFNGLFVSSATGSYVYCITLIYLLAKYKRAIFKRLPNLVIIASMFCLGTKVSYLFLAVFFAIYLWQFTTINKKLIGSLFVVLGVFILYVFFFKFGIFNEIRQQDGLISSLMSYRDELLLERTVPYILENWSFLNYLFGGVSDLSTKSQIEFIDVFYFFGVIGGFLYYFIFFRIFLIFKAHIYVAILLSALFIIVLLTGNFFGYPSIAIYLVILREYLEQNEQNKHPQYINS
ncbi:hypothetical protein [Gelidibacter sp.]|uniref:hypothetical protein n=1 Tax=Gelidibacter sp. TaxID=2018083 RepID=UPI003266659D